MFIFVIQKQFFCKQTSQLMKDTILSIFEVKRIFCGTKLI